MMTTTTYPYPATLPSLNGLPTYTYNNTPMSQQLQSNSGNIMTVFITKEEEVDSYPVAAGTTVQLICFPANKFWLKSTSTNGVPEALREFEFKEISKPNIVQGTGVTREEFDSLSKKIDKLINDLGGASNG